MKNSNDSLKEKEIKKETPLKQDKLENISGGASTNWHWSPYINYCFCVGTDSQCKKVCNDLTCGCIEWVRDMQHTESDRRLPRIIYNKCTICGDCLGKCKAIEINNY